MSISKVILALKRLKCQEN